MELINTEEYKNLVDRISSAYSVGKDRAIQSINTELVLTYWSIYSRVRTARGFARKLWEKALGAIGHRPYDATWERV